MTDSLLTGSSTVKVLDKLEVEVNLFRVGKYKSAMEPWIRNDMSPEAKEANLFWIGSLWQQYLEAVSRQRGIPLENLSDAHQPFCRPACEPADGDFAQFALELGLVDQLVNRPEANLALASAGAAGEGSEGFRQVGFENYLALTDMQDRSSFESEKSLVVVAEGEIVRGATAPGCGRCGFTVQKTACAGRRQGCQGRRDADQQPWRRCFRFRENPP